MNESDHLRAALVRHIDFPGAAAAPATPSLSTLSVGCEVAPGIPLDQGGVFPRPACVARFVREDRRRLVLRWVATLALLLVVEVVVIALVMGAGK